MVDVVVMVFSSPNFSITPKNLREVFQQDPRDLVEVRSEESPNQSHSSVLFCVVFMLFFL